MTDQLPISDILAWIDCDSTNDSQPQDSNINLDINKMPEVVNYLEDNPSNPIFESLFGMYSNDQSTSDLEWKQHKTDDRNGYSFDTHHINENILTSSEIIYEIKLNDEDNTTHGKKDSENCCQIELNSEITDLNEFNTTSNDLKIGNNENVEYLNSEILNKILQKHDNINDSIHTVISNYTRKTALLMRAAVLGFIFKICESGHNVALHTFDQIQQHPVVFNSVSFFFESMNSTNDRVQYFFEEILIILTLDDPETKYLKFIKDGLEGGDWSDLLRLRSRHASLTLQQRTLVTSGSVVSDDIPAVVVNQAITGSLISILGKAKSISSQIQALIQTASRQGNVAVNSILNKINSFPIVEESIEENLDIVDDDLDPVEEAGYTLTKLFVPPKFQEDTKCKFCNQEFNFGCLRHHCRNCGSSFCNKHSSKRRRILHYGITIPSRVCDSCAKDIDKAAFEDDLYWRELRVNDYLAGNLLPYRNPVVDRRIDKISRITDCALQVIKNSLYLSYPTMLAIETLDILKRYGFTGLAGVLMRKDFMEAVETLKRISGLDSSYPLSLHELTACIYYKMAVERGLRGCMPDEEHNCHNPEICEEATNEDIQSALRFAPLALQAVYAETAVECQHIAHIQGWSMIFCEMVSQPEEPAFALFATDIDHYRKASSRNQQNEANEIPRSMHGLGHSNQPKTTKSSNKHQIQYRKEVILAIRGTNSIHDIVTDIRADPISFPPSTASEEEYASAHERDPWLLVTSTGQSYACGGMVRAAMWLYARVSPSLIALKEKHCDIILCGHSLGGGVAALLTYLLSMDIPNIRCFTFGSPSCVSKDIAESLDQYVTSVVLHDDIVSRVTPQSIRLLLKELISFRKHVNQHLHQDMKDVLERAGTLWSPRWRDVHPQEPKVEQQQSVDVSSDDVFLLVDRDKDDNFITSQIKVEFDEIDKIAMDALVDLWIPGRILHIYAHCGQYKAMLVPRNFTSLRKIEVQGNIFNDHAGTSIINALHEIIAVRNAISTPLPWQPFDSTEVCACCKNKFTWHSTFRGKIQEYREMHNCRCCGLLVCTPCSEKRYPITKFGLIFPSRICDLCVSRGNFH